MRPADMIRHITVGDARSLIDIARECYDYAFDEAHVTAWLERALAAAPSVLSIRDDDAFGFCQVSGVPWNPNEIHGAVLYLGMRKAAVWQGCKILKTMRDYAIAKGALDFHFGEATNMRMDVFARRIGAVPNRPTYVYRPGIA